MMTYEDYLAKAILSDKTSNITKVNKIDEIKTLFYHAAIYNQAIALMKEGNVEAIKALEPGKKTFEDITIVKFANQHGVQFIASIYDSDEL